MVVLLVVALTFIGAGVSRTEAARITPGRFLYVDFDVVVGEGRYDPNLIFLGFRGGTTFTPGATATASLFIDDVLRGSTTGDSSCLNTGICSSLLWEFATPGFPTVPLFQYPTIVDLSSLHAGSHVVITLTMESGMMEFGLDPYQVNAPFVVFDNIASCGPNCTSIRGANLDAARNPSDGPRDPNWVVRSVPDPGSSLLLPGVGLAGLGAGRKRWQ
jgi:hypothetical protein